MDDMFLLHCGVALRLIMRWLSELGIPEIQKVIVRITKVCKGLVLTILIILIAHALIIFAVVN